MGLKLCRKQAAKEARYKESQRDWCNRLKLCKAEAAMEAHDKEFKGRGEGCMRR